MSKKRTRKISTTLKTPSVASQEIITVCEAIGDHPLPGSHLVVSIRGRTGKVLFCGTKQECEEFVKEGKQ